MIKANELRIGNILYSNLTERNFICNSEDIYNLAMDYNANNANYVELTEEWLLKFGFEKDDTGVDMFDQDYCEWYQIEFPIIGVLCQSSDKSYLFDENTDTLRIKYVHQLQNLYFALTGEELTIKNS